MVSAILAVIFIATVFISALVYNSGSINIYGKKEYWRVPFLLVILVFFISWSVSVLNRYSGQHDSLLSVLTFFTVGAIFYASAHMCDLVSFFNKPGQQPSAFTAIPAIMLAAAVARSFMPEIYDNIFYGMYRMAIFFAVYFVINFLLSGFRSQINKYIKSEYRKAWVHSSWVVFGIFMSLVVISIYIGFSKPVLNWITDNSGPQVSHIITAFINFVANMNFLFI